MTSNDLCTQDDTQNDIQCYINWLSRKGFFKGVFREVFEGEFRWDFRGDFIEDFIGDFIGDSKGDFIQLKAYKIQSLQIRFYSWELDTEVGGLVFI